ncbi:MAG: nuclear transport factor 2 family protein [Kangiellaceae bacterium]|nr:nuclear transport factor 2 family protein [Kangiellaceae bacterium]MCW9000212.1 nuclear transport factor 2 family protein [Kangiellaceae bacterium]MCW9018634.1 nuclear transport factor 2 family protein [Kangiellaceae bacterium]
MWKRYFLIIVVISAVISGKARGCGFKCTLQKHIDAIQERDFQKFETTITQGKELTFILPNGKFYQSTDEYKSLLKDWFAQDGWTFSPKIISQVEGQDMASALLLIDYREKNRNGKPYHLKHFLSLVFKKEGDEWRLIHDQNTKAFQLESAKN